MKPIHRIGIVAAVDAGKFKRKSYASTAFSKFNPKFGRVNTNLIRESMVKKLEGSLQ